MKHMIIALVATGSLLGATLAQEAAAAEQTSALSLAQAKEIQAKAEAVIASHNIGGVVVIVDAAGHLITSDRLDGASLANVELAPKKAFTAVAFGAPTQSWADKLAQGNTAILGNPEIVPLPGGVPIVIDGKVVGAIGVSTPQGPIDAEAANAAVAGL